VEEQSPNDDFFACTFKREHERNYVVDQMAPLQALQSEIQNSIILFEVTKNCLISGRKTLLHQFRRRAIKPIAVINKEYHRYQLQTQFHHIS
jgi:hypothetical protein